MDEPGKHDAKSNKPVTEMTTIRFCTNLLKEVENGMEVTRS